MESPQSVCNAVVTVYLPQCQKAVFEAADYD